MEIKEVSKNVIKYEVDGKVFDSEIEAQEYIDANDESSTRYISDCNDLEFNVSEDHLKLLKGMSWEWWDCEFGSPSVDCKRPYGNSGSRVYSDIAEILEIPRVIVEDEEGEEEEWYTEKQLEYMYSRHRETETYLQILFQFGEIPSGKYKRKALWEDWEKVE